MDLTIITIIISVMLSLVPIDGMGKDEDLSKSLLKAVNVYESEQYPKALDMFTSIMRQAEAMHDSHTYIICTGYIGNIYNAFGDNNTCATYYEKGYEAAKDANDRNLQSSFLTNLVTAYCKIGDIAKANHYYRLAMVTPNSKDRNEWQYYIYYDHARILQAERKYEEAVAAHQKALTYAKNNRMKPLFLLFQLSEIGNLYVLMGNNKAAVAMGDTCLTMAKSLGSGELMTNAYKMLADGYEHDAMTDSARKYRALFFAFNDSVYNTKKFYNARHKLDEYEGQMNMRHISSLTTRINHQDYIIIGIGVFLIVLATLSVIIIRKNQRLVQAQRLLIAKNGELEKRDKDSQVLLAKYLKQLQSSGKNNVDIVDGYEKDVSPASRQPSVRLNDNDEASLLMKINSVLSDEAVISNPDFSLQMLSESVDSNTRYVSWVINDSYHKTFKTLLNELRIRNASHKLIDQEHYGRYTMQAVYEAVGYTNAVSFNRAFKKIYGMTPSEYQRLALAED